MKIYKSEVDEWGWFLRARLRKDGWIVLDRKRLDGKMRPYWTCLQCDLKKLKKAIKYLEEGVGGSDEKDAT